MPAVTAEAAAAEAVAAKAAAAETEAAAGSDSKHEKPKEFCQSGNETSCDCLIILIRTFFYTAANFFHMLCCSVE